MHHSKLERMHTHTQVRHQLKRELSLDEAKLRAAAPGLPPAVAAHGWQRRTGSATLGAPCGGVRAVGGGGDGGGAATGGGGGGGLST